jgi:hypothetical protein
MVKASGLRAFFFAFYFGWNGIGKTNRIGLISYPAK